MIHHDRGCRQRYRGQDSHPDLAYRVIDTGKFHCVIPRNNNTAGHPAGLLSIHTAPIPFRFVAAHRPFPAHRRSWGYRLGPGHK